MGKGAVSLEMLKDRAKKATWSGRVVVLVAGLAVFVIGLAVLAAGLEAGEASSEARTGTGFGARFGPAESGAVRGVEADGTALTSTEATAQANPKEQPSESRLAHDGTD